MVGYWQSMLRALEARVQRGDEHRCENEGVIASAPRELL